MKNWFGDGLDAMVGGARRTHEELWLNLVLWIQPCGEYLGANVIIQFGTLDLVLWPRHRNIFPVLFIVLFTMYLQLRELGPIHVDIKLCYL